jgi:hypothetical protein
MVMSKVEVVPLAPLRMQLVSLMKDGFSYIPLKDLFAIIEIIMQDYEAEIAPNPTPDTKG